MNVFKSRLPLWAVRLVGLFALIVAFSPMAPASAATPAEQFVQQNIEKGYTILNNASLSATQRRAQFRDFMMSLADTRRIGTFTLGPYANRAAKAELDAFHEAFIDYAVAVYESRLSKYTGQSLRVTGSQQRAADDVIVNADAVNPNAPPNSQPIKVAFRVRNQADGRMIVTDMQVEGVWLALSQRSDFTGFLQQNGGSLSALTDHLRMQARQVSNNVPAAGRG